MTHRRFTPPEEMKWSPPLKRIRQPELAKPRIGGKTQATYHHTISWGEGLEKHWLAYQDAHNGMKLTRFIVELMERYFADRIGYQNERFPQTIDPPTEDEV